MRAVSKRHPLVEIDPRLHDARTHVEVFRQRLSYILGIGIDSGES